MNRFEITVKHKHRGVMQLRTVEAIAKSSIDALVSVVAAINPQGMFTAAVRPTDPMRKG